MQRGRPCKPSCSGLAEGMLNGVRGYAKARRTPGCWTNGRWPSENYAVVGEKFQCQLLFGTKMTYDVPRQNSGAYGKAGGSLL
jgi:hypothetical protein